MEYKVEDYFKYLYVFSQEKLILTVKHKNAFSGRRITSFFKEDKLIFKTSYLVFFKKFIKIEYQDLGINVDLIKSKGDYFLVNEENEYKVTMHFLNPPPYRFYINNILVGDAKTKRFIPPFHRPVIFNVTMDCDQEKSLILLLAWLMNLPTDVG